VENYRAEREATDLFQVDMARLCGCNPTTAWRWERDDLPVPQYARTVLKMWGMLTPEQRDDLFRWLMAQ